MAQLETDKNPPFRYGVRASGLGEVWTHTEDKHKFTQFGWRCSTKESSYCNNTLIGNWNEQRYNIQSILEEKPLPSQFAHYFATTAKNDYYLPPVGVEHPSTKQQLKRIAGKEPVSFPGHQPELDHSLDKELYNCFITTSRTAYVHPGVRKAPIAIPKHSA